MANKVNRDPSLLLGNAVATDSKFIAGTNEKIGTGALAQDAFVTQAEAEKKAESGAPITQLGGGDSTGQSFAGDVVSSAFTGNLFSTALLSGPVRYGLDRAAEAVGLEPRMGTSPNYYMQDKAWSNGGASTFANSLQKAMESEQEPMTPQEYAELSKTANREQAEAFQTMMMLRRNERQYQSQLSGVRQLGAGLIAGLGDPVNLGLGLAANMAGRAASTAANLGKVTSHAIETAADVALGYGAGSVLASANAEEYTSEQAAGDAAFAVGLPVVIGAFGKTFKASQAFGSWLQSRKAEAAVNLPPEAIGVKLEQTETGDVKEVVEVKGPDIKMTKEQVDVITEQMLRGEISETDYISVLDDLDPEVRKQVTDELDLLVEGTDINLLGADSVKAGDTVEPKVDAGDAVQTSAKEIAQDITPTNQAETLLKAASEVEMKPASTTDKAFEFITGDKAEPVPAKQIDETAVVNANPAADKVNKLGKEAVTYPETSPMAAIAREREERAKLAKAMERRNKVLANADQLDRLVAVRELDKVDVDTVRANLNTWLDTVGADRLSPSTTAVYREKYPALMTPKELRITTASGARISVTLTRPEHIAMGSAWGRNGKNKGAIYDVSRAFLRERFGMSDKEITHLSDQFRKELEANRDITAETQAFGSLTREHKTGNETALEAIRNTTYRPAPQSAAHLSMQYGIASRVAEGIVTPEYAKKLIDDLLERQSDRELADLRTRLDGDATKFKEHVDYLAQRRKAAIKLEKDIISYRRDAYTKFKYDSRFDQDAKYSQAYAGGGDTTQAIKDTLANHPMKELASLYKKGAIEVVPTIKDVDGDHPDSVVAMYRKGKTYLIADKLTPETLDAVLLHELGVHAGMEGMLGKDLFDKLKSDIFDSPDFAELRAKLEANGNIPAEYIAEEMIAYAVQFAPKSTFTQSIISAIKTWIYAMFDKIGLARPSLNSADLRHMAIRSLRKLDENYLEVVNGATPFNEDGDLYSLGNMLDAKAEQAKPIEERGKPEGDGIVLRALAKGSDVIDSNNVTRFAADAVKRTAGSASLILRTSENPYMREIGKMLTTNMDDMTGRGTGIDHYKIAFTQKISSKYYNEMAAIVDDYVKSQGYAGIGVLKGLTTNEINYKVQEELIDAIGIAFQRGTSDSELPAHVLRGKKLFSNTIKDIINEAKFAKSQLDRLVQVDDSHAVWHFANITHSDNYFPQLIDYKNISNLLGSGVKANEIEDLIADALLTVEGSDLDSVEARKVAAAYTARAIEIAKLPDDVQAEMLSNPLALRKFLIDKANFTEQMADMVIDMGDSHIGSRTKNRMFAFDYTKTKTMSNGTTVTMHDLFQIEANNVLANYLNQASFAVATANMLKDGRTSTSLKYDELVNVNKIPKGMIVKLPDGHAAFNLGAPGALDALHDLAASSNVYSKRGLHNTEVDALESMIKLARGLPMSPDRGGVGLELLKAATGVTAGQKGWLHQISVIGDLAAKFNSRTGGKALKTAAQAIKMAAEVGDTETRKLVDEISYLAGLGFNEGSAVQGMHRRDDMTDDVSFVSKAISKKIVTSVYRNTGFNWANRVNQTLNVLSELAVIKEYAQKGNLSASEKQYMIRMGIPAEKFDQVAQYVDRAVYYDGQGRLRIDQTVDDVDAVRSIVQTYLNRRVSLGNTELAGSNVPLAIARNKVSSVFLQFANSVVAGTRLRVWDGIKHFDTEHLTSMIASMAASALITFMLASTKQDKEREKAMSVASIAKGAFERSAYSGYLPKLIDLAMALTGNAPVFSRGRVVDILNPNPAAWSTVTDALAGVNTLTRGARQQVFGVGEGEKEVTAKDFKPLARTLGASAAIQLGAYDLLTD